jgi:hypothetical protein
MSRLLPVVLMFAFMQCSEVAGTKYYISNSTGNDRLDGRTEMTAWKTIAKVNSKSFLPGDSILFKKGDVWRETLIVPSSGMQQKVLFFHVTEKAGIHGFLVPPW